MRSGSLPLRLLVQLIVVLLVNFTDAGNLDFYQDVEPEMPEDITYKQIARYLESKNHEPREMQRPRMVPNLPWTYAEILDNRRRKEKILETLLENPAILDVLQNEKMKNRDEVVHWPRAYDTREDYSRVNEAALRPYMSANPASSRFEDYNNVKIPFVKNFFKNEKPYYVHDSSNPQRSNPLLTENYLVEDVEAERLLKLQGKLMDLGANRERAEEAESPQVSEQEPEFTFKFDDPKVNERDTFAIKPNDPRYYEDDGRATSIASNEETTSNVEKVSDSMKERFDPFATIDEEPKSNTEYVTESNIIRDKFSLMGVIIPDRRVERDPLVVSTRMTNNDIYFIAIVAGCSAAAMFALVLIALTWCRLHRGAKAAADIEYPAYGVTGPNKDISPSGDQRLAHSAQMYHFQHQKQQIIAMENRTAASRDPGSVSEAESDEENEEGDYTVYECPGLASTAEMEVKNPMFHDDPTPATPPQIHKEEDHM